MIETYQNELSVYPDSIHYVPSVVDFAFGYIYHSNSLVDMLVTNDDGAKSISGWDGNGNAPSGYYAALWQGTKEFTLDQLQRATVALASLWYTAWVNVGLGTSVRDFRVEFPKIFMLEQNYPNPFNPTTNFHFTIDILQLTTLRVYDILGREVATLVNEVKQPGEYTVRWDARQVPTGRDGLASGVYFYHLEVKNVAEPHEVFRQVRRMMLLK